MTARRLAPDLWVSPQITPNELVPLRARGFRSIIVNRCDGEEQDQPCFQAMRGAGEQLGMTVISIPVSRSRVGEIAIEAFAMAMQALDGPILAYCSSGRRPATLWALALAPSLGPDTVLGAASEAGHDLSDLRPRLVRLWHARPFGMRAL